MLSIEPHDLDDETAEDIFYGVFDGLWFDFPTPFKTGDIVWDPNHSYGFCGGPFVLTDICLEGIEDERRKGYIRNNADSSDMLAYGYFIDSDAGICSKIADTLELYFLAAFFISSLYNSMIALFSSSAAPKSLCDER